ncbi:MAG: hypothetical protein ACI3V0_02790 [Faecousia sp.]
MKRKILTLFLAMALVVGIAAPAFAAEEEEPVSEVPVQIISIQTADDLLVLAENCSLDTWSYHTEVVLQADISLAGTDFSGIATFAGIFNGNGHTISGLDIMESMAPTGLFRYLQPTAVVKNLTVCGRVTPGGDAVTVGGIVGENHGTVENCAFIGEVKGETDTGGIAGANYGTIRQCQVSGSLSGANRTGGVAGYNQGIIDGCENAMEINVDCVDPTIDPTAIDLNFNMDISRLSSLDTADAASNTGGITGYSAGTVISCKNTGSVGYPHIGYNLGGIIGRNCGIVGDCHNEGHIQGRKDAGGIVGQMEPNIAAILSPDYLETLSKQFENLGNLISAAGSHAAGAGDDIRSCVETIAAYQSSARAALDAIVSLGGGDFGDTISAVETLRNSIAGMVSTTRNLQTIIAGSVEDLSDDVGAISGQISSISRTFALATEDAKQETISDISSIDLAEISEGKVLDCSNSGLVEADLNVGGIVGIMGLEYEIDPEDDAPNGSSIPRRRYELKAIVQNCVNTGIVTGKRSYVGGICGRMELGLITASQGYGTITSESGDYVGGIAGLAGGTIRDCFSKCSLEGGSYIGGIVGCGIAEDFSGESSTVSGCYSMVQINRYEQYIGGVSGAYIGNFTSNYFVSDTLKGMNGVSYFALAEPLTYDALRKTEGLPRALRQFTLSFTADGETIKTVPFDYGDSFDSSVYPEIPQKEGYYAQWSTDDLTDLRFDKVVEVEYIPHMTALNSTDVRPSGKPILFVQGQFKAGDYLMMTYGTTDFPEKEGQTLLEHWEISIPADGLESHIIRYLPIQENVELYLLKKGNWSRVSAENMGSYLAFAADGAEVEIAVVSTQTGRTRWVILASGLAAVLVLAVSIFAVRKRRKGKNSKDQKETLALPDPVKPKKKKKNWHIFLTALVLVGICAAAAVLLCFPHTKAGQSVRSFDILNAYLEQPRQEMALTVKANIEDKNANFTARISKGKVDNTAISMICEGERKLYFADGAVFLENGAAYQLNQTAPDYSGLLEQVLAVCGLVEAESFDGVYTMTAEGAQAQAILKLLLPSAHAMLPDANRLTVDLLTEGNSLTQIRFTGAGNLTDSVKTPFSLSATVDILPASGDLQVPEAVSKAVSSGSYQAQELYSDDLVRLIEAWSHIRSQNPMAAEVALEGDCGPLGIQDCFQFYQWKLDDNLIWGAEKQGKILYFTKDAVCNGEGRTVSADEAKGLDAVKALDIAYRSFSSADFQCREAEDSYLYTVTLAQDGMKQIVDALFPQAGEMEISYGKGSIQLVICQEQIQSIQVTCGGSVKVISAQAEVQFCADIRFQDESAAPVLPDAVKDALHK